MPTYFLSNDNHPSKLLEISIHIILHVVFKISKIRIGIDSLPTYKLKKSNHKTIPTRNFSSRRKIYESFLVNTYK